MTEPAQLATHQAETPGLLNALGVLRRRWWLPLLCGLVCVIVAGLLVSREHKRYTAIASLRFTTNTLPSQVAGVQENEVVDPEGNKATYVQLVTATPVAELVIKALELRVTPTELLRNVTASNPENDYVVQVSAENESPQLAATIANTFAREYVTYSQQQNEAQLIKGEQLIDQRFAELPASDTTDRTNLRDLYQKLLLLQAVQTSDAQVVDTATVPESPTSPKVKDTLAIALILGILVGVGLTFLFNLLDRRVKSWEELEELYGISALAGIPQIPRRMRDRESMLEPFRILHNSLSALTLSGEVKTVLVTSAVPGEGKTTVALGLARAAAGSGQNVILVEADFRRPTLQQQMLMTEHSAHTGAIGTFVSHSPGLSSVMRTGGDPLECLQSPIPGLDNLKVLFSGARQINGLNLRSAHVLQRIIDSLAAHADLVIIDSPPLLPVADTRVLLDHAPIDACLVVARTGRATREEARRARAVVEQHGLTSIGLVINSISEVSDNKYYGYGISDEPSDTKGGPEARSDSGLGRPVRAQGISPRRDMPSVASSGAGAAPRR
jgi:polysaccharide biosynthesis transport protein